MARWLGMWAAACVITAAAWGQEAGRLTFTKDVLPILQENCATCHRPAGTNLSGMIAPMSLTTYEEVRPWAKAIKRVVSERVMPPWHATEDTRGVFRNERTLTREQIDTIVNWVDQGAARGNPADAPAPPQYPSTGWSIGVPDLILEFDEPYWVADEVEDIQPVIPVKITKEQLPEARWIQAMEFKAGSEVVHHIVTFAVAPGETLQLDNRKMLGRIAPGTDPQRYDDGFGFLLQPESTMYFAMHYHKETGPGTGAWDRSQMGIKFHDKPVIHPVDISAIAHGDFEVPPYHPKWKVGGAHVFDEDFILVDLMPHMHLRGSSAKYTAYYPDGGTEVLLNVPNYDYNWQTGYEYKEYKRMPKGTRIEWEITYDNSPEHAELVGVDPSKAVRFGGPTTDEMDLGFFTYALQEPNKMPTTIRTGGQSK